MEQLWSNIEDWLGQYLPEVLADLNAGCSYEEISELEKCLKCRLPDDFKHCYRRHNGQKGNTSGLFCGLPFLCINELYYQWTAWQELAGEDFATEITGESYPYGAIKPTYINLQWIPFTHDGSGNHLGIDLDPGVDGVVGQVINFGTDENNKFVLAPSLTDFMSWMLVQYRSGNYQSSSRSLALQEPPNNHFLDIVPQLFGKRK